MGVFTCQICGELDSYEYDELLHELSGQASDGWGESFEQHEIHTSEGDIYVSFYDTCGAWNLIHEHVFLRNVLEHFDMKLSVSIEEAELIIMNGVSHAAPLPKTAEMLKVLKNVGIRTGIVSNLCWSGKALSRRLQGAFPEHHFDFVITSSEYIFRKPDVHIFDMAVRKSGLDKTDIWYCGNNKEADIIGAHEAGLFPVFYDDRSVPSRLHERNDKISVNFPYLHLNSWDDLIDCIMMRNMTSNC